MGEYKFFNSIGEMVGVATCREFSHAVNRALGWNMAVCSAQDDIRNMVRTVVSPDGTEFIVSTEA